MQVKYFGLFFIILCSIIFVFGNLIPGEVWNVFRFSNQYLGLIAFFFVTVRLGMMLGDKKHPLGPAEIHLIFWFSWISVALLNSSFGAAYYNSSPVDANFTSGVRTILHLLAIGLSVWWPQDRFVRRSVS